MMGLMLKMFQAFAEGIGDAFDDGPIEMLTGDRIGEADDRAFGQRTGKARAPIRLEHKSIASGRNEF
jgi:hypothetical protein